MSLIGTYEADFFQDTHEDYSIAGLDGDDVIFGGDSRRS